MICPWVWVTRVHWARKTSKKASCFVLFISLSMIHSYMLAWITFFPDTIEIIFSRPDHILNVSLAWRNCGVTGAWLTCLCLVETDSQVSKIQKMLSWKEKTNQERESHVTFENMDKMMNINIYKELSGRVGLEVERPWCEFWHHAKKGMKVVTVYDKCQSQTIEVVSFP